MIAGQHLGRQRYRLIRFKQGIGGRDGRLGNSPALDDVAKIDHRRDACAVTADQQVVVVGIPMDDRLSQAPLQAVDNRQAALEHAASQFAACRILDRIAIHPQILPLREVPAQVPSYPVVVKTRKNFVQAAHDRSKLARRSLRTGG